MLDESRKEAILTKLAAQKEKTDKSRWGQVGKATKRTSSSMKNQALRGKLPPSSAITPGSVSSRHVLTPGIEIPV